MINEAQLEKYRVLYKKRFGTEISKIEALEQGATLVSLVELIYRPLTEAELDVAQNQPKAL